jgi:1,4-dihydroxy-2-naphthoyl-CoA hydrolase
MTTNEDMLAEVLGMSAGTLAERMGIEFLEAAPDRVVATMPVEGNTQPYGLLHGGASAVLAETLGSIGSALHAGRDKIAVGVDINATHHRAVRSGMVTGIATPLHLGSSVTTYEVVVNDERDRRVCTSRITCMLRTVPAGKRPA